MENQPAMEDQPVGDNIPGENVTFRLPGNCRAPNTSIRCMVYNCTNNTRRRVQKSF